MGITFASTFAVTYLVALVAVITAWNVAKHLVRRRSR